MRVVVGLGNPGKEYVGTRHNAGFMVVDELARRWGVEFGKERRGARLARSRFAGEPVVLMQPLSFMNCSGDAVARMDADLRPSAGDLVVVHDDLDLAVGRVAVKRGGGTGGHRGLASLVAWGGPDFIRVRLGVGRPPANQDAAAFVLRPFRSEERTAIDGSVRRAADAVEAVLGEGVERAMSAFNSRPAVVAGTSESSQENR